MADDRLIASLAAELEAMRAELEELGAVLCGDVDVVRRHMVALQALDELGQRAAAIADVLRADDRVNAVRLVPLAGLAARLAAA